MSTQSKRTEAIADKRDADPIDSYIAQRKRPTAYPVSVDEVRTRVDKAMGDQSLTGLLYKMRDEGA